MIVPRYATACMAGLVVWCASAPSLGQTYSLTPLGDLPGQGFASWGTRLNNNDHVTGESISADSGIWVEAFHWDSGTMIPLGTINPTPFFTKGKDVNDLDEVTGWSLTDDGWQGFFWDSGGGMIGIGYDGGCVGGEGLTFTSYGEGINNSSQVVGTTSTATNCGEAFIWSGGTFTNLLGFLSGDVESGAYDLNDASPVQVVGRSIDAFGKRQAMIWDSVNGMVALTSLSGYDESDAVAVNDFGDAVGICYDNVNGVNMATTWLTANGMAPQALGYVNTGDYISQCWDINNSVEVVGESYGSSGGVGFIWDSVNGLRDLNNHLDGSGAGWQLWWARGINHSGHISGTGTNPSGDTEAYLLTPVGGDGACCVPGVGCFISSEDNCLGMGGTFLGGGTDCGPPDPCLADPEGACCDVPGVGCFVTTENDCLGAGGTYIGDGTTCNPDPCLAGVDGACCDVPGVGCFVAPEADCLAQGGTYQGDGTTCTPDPCLVIGACCTEDAAGNPICIETSEADCDGMMGFYLGDGTTCDPDSCECTEPPVEMIAWWPLDEVVGTVAEELILGNDGFHVGPIPPLPTPAAGMVDGALDFDGVDDEVRVPDDVMLNFDSGDDEFSIDAWVFADSFSVTHAPIVDKRDGKTGYYFYLLDGNPALMLADNGTAPGWTEYCCGGPLILPGAWHHVAVTLDRIDPSGVKFYVDGVLAPPPTVDDPTDRPGDLTNPNDLLIGAAAYTYTPGDGRPFFDGRIDEVEIFRGVLSAATIAAIYNAGPSGKCKPDDGACCIQGLPCQILPEIDCLSQGGVFQGGGTDCDPDPCVTEGACCTEDADGNPLCLILTEDECDAVTGIYYGDGTSCTPDPCQVHGACCVEIAGVSTCIEMIEADCDAMMGIYQGDGTTCVPDDPCVPIGACCAEDSAGNPFCIETTEADCDALMGVYQGDGTTCTPDPCIEGACCIDDGAGGTFCIETTVDDCLAQNGIYQGDGTTCTPDDPCEPEVGACCRPDGSCIDGLSADECENQFGGIYGGDGTTCADIECVGACCFEDGSCIDAISLIECQAQGGDFQGVGVLCSDVTCPAPIGACCVFDPIENQFVCSQTTFIECEAIGGTYLGDGVPCDPDPCNPDPTGACCIETEPGCIITTPDNCQALGGTYNGDDTTCDEVMCPEVCGIDLSTGTTNGLPDAFGAVDPDWTVNFTPTGGAGPAYSIAPVTSWVTTSGANWVDPYNTGGSGSSGYDPVGDYEFQIQFTLDFATQQDFVLSIDVAADNASSYFLNGNAIGSSTGFGSLNTVSTTNQTFFVNGLNTLVATASNSSLWMGLLVEGDVTWRSVVADLSTGTTGGTVDPFGTIDPDWSVNFTPIGGAGPAFSIAPVTSWVNTAGANWIDPFNTGGSDSTGYDPVGDYEFQIQFTLDFATQSNFDLTIDTAVDNSADFFLNGNYIGSPGGFATLTTLNTSNQSFFVNGVNTLTAAVNNAGLWMGLLVDGDVTADCGEAPTGACCTEDAAGNPLCFETTEDDCDNQGGLYLGDGTDCSLDPPCPLEGACCTEDAAGNPLCFETTEDVCDEEGGTYLGDGVSCTPNPCIPIGACCIHDPLQEPPDFCIETTQQDCVDQGGTYLGDGTLCFDGLCEDPCVDPPDDMMAWWPLDELSGTTAADIAGGNTANHVGSPTPDPNGQVDGSLIVDSSNFLEANGVPFNFGQGNFSIDAWVKVEPGGNGELWIVDRDQPFHFAANPYTSSPPHLNYQCGTAFWPGPMAEGVWTHLAVTVEFNTTDGLKQYLDGVQVGMVDTCPYNINFGTTPLGIGGGTGGPAERRIDEVEIFDRVLDPAEILAIFDAGPGGKCKDTCHVPWDLPYCLNETVNSTVLYICNNSPISHDYSWTAITLPADPPDCTVDGPTVFTPPGGTVTVPGQTCIGVTITIDRPSGLGANDIGCYDIAVINLDTNQTHACSGSVWGTNTWCITPVPWPTDPIAVPIGLPAPIDWEVANDDDPVGMLDYTIAAMSSMDEVVPISLDGLPPGEPVTGSVELGEGESTIVSITAEFTEHVPFRFYDLIFEADTDGDGVMEALASVGLRSLLPCEGDANRDGAVDPLDSGYVLARFGCAVGSGDEGCDAADVNGDGEVNPLDGGFVLARFGQCL